MSIMPQHGHFEFDKELKVFRGNPNLKPHIYSNGLAISHSLSDIMHIKVNNAILILIESKKFGAYGRILRSAPETKC